MRLCFDVNRHSHASAGNAVISKSGLGADMDIVFFLHQTNQTCDVIEFYGSAHELARLFKLAAQEAENTINLIREQKTSSVSIKDEK